MNLQLPPLPGSTARLLRWLRAVGDTVTATDPLAVVLTDRVEAVVPAGTAGTLAELLVDEGDDIAVDATIAQLAAPSESNDESAIAPQAQATAPRSAATPLARRIAAYHGVDVTSIAGSGRGGRVLKGDVLAQLDVTETAIIAPPNRDTPTVAPPREASGFAPGLPMFAAATSSDMPRALVAIEVVLDQVVGYCTAHEAAFARRGLALTPAACIVAMALAELPQHPLLNAQWSDDGLVLRRRQHVAIVDQTPPGETRHHLITDAGDLNTRGVVRVLANPAEVEDPLVHATFAVITDTHGTTLLNTAALPTAVCAILHIGRITVQPVVCDQRILAKPVAFLALSYDVRVLHHGQANCFLDRVRHRSDWFHG